MFDRVDCFGKAKVCLSSLYGSLLSNVMTWGNGRSYVLILESGPTADASQSKQYFSRISTKVGFCRVRVPFSSFRPVNPADPPLDPFLIHTLTIRFEPRRQNPHRSAPCSPLKWNSMAELSRRSKAKF
uniref:High chlorophyll fluorescence phenotype 173 n=1 Tax=Tanacetum cinerariifolium TaxID=118510 RepID=A0A6L2NRD8_TANCI|nr:high chlorophyll fluorescence phenotype 173 [Tanacetum cinerariifolium]